jgi:alpha-beta hydrolase superfamily lysophospholipase
MIAVAVMGGLIVFGTSSAPAWSATITAYRGIDFSRLPEVEHCVARDGAALGYRRYGVSAALPGPPQVVVLIHGASDSAPSLHRLALSLQAAGVKTYVPELHGHGSSIPHGDISYVSRLDDHLVAPVNVLRHRAGAVPLRLAKVSIGGGFALRFARGAQAHLFDG